MKSFSAMCPRRVSAVGSVILLAILHGCAGGLGLRSSAPPIVSVHEGPNLLVLCHFPCGPLGPVALERAEAAWDVAAAYLERNLKPEGTPPPTIHLYGSEPEYAAVEASIAGGRFRETRGFSSRDSRSAHLLVEATLKELVEDIGLPFHYLRAIAHEAAHLATYDLAAGAYWPPWLAEGFAGWVERETGGIALESQKSETNPWASTHLWRVQRLQETDTLPTAHDLLLGARLQLTIPDAYALWTEFFHFLVSGPFADETRELVLAVSEEPIQEEFAWPIVAAAAEKVFDSDRMREVDEAFRDHLSESRPKWMEIRRTLQSVDQASGRWLQFATSSDPGGALAWRVAGLPVDKGVRIDTRVEPLGNGPWEARLALGRSNGADPLLLALESDGTVQLFQFPSVDPGSLTRVAETPPPSPDLVLEGEQLIELEFGAGELRITWGPDQLEAHFPLEAHFELSDSEPNGVWGVGVGPGSAAVWSALPGTDPGHTSFP